jgi:hypothetical protein
VEDGSGQRWRAERGVNEREAYLVALATEDLTGDGGEGKVTDTKVGNLETGRLKFGDAEDLLEVRVEDVEETVAETPD